MKKFEFQLESLLRVSRQKERLIELQEKEIRTAMDTARQQIVDLQTQLQESADHATRETYSRATVSGLVAQRAFAGATLAEIGELNTSIDEMMQEINKVLQQRIQQRQETRSLETLREGEWKNWRSDRSKSEQAALLETLVRTPKQN